MRTMQLFVIGDRGAVETHLRRLADLPGLHRLVPGHGGVIEEDASGILSTIADTL